MFAVLTVSFAIGHSDHFRFTTLLDFVSKYVFCTVFSFGKACTLSCTNGFLIGSSVITCQASGQWSVIKAQCASQLPGSNSPPQRILLSSPFVPENSPPGTVIGRLTTVDNDEEQFFIYSLIDSAGVFDVDNNASTLVLTGAVDYEIQTVYTVCLVSIDSGVPQLSVKQNLTVHVTDVNEAPSKLALIGVSIAYRCSCSIPDQAV